jgi:hypothetical protein
MPANGNFDTVHDEVDANGNVIACQMERLRDAAGAARLGKWVGDKIHDELRSRGMGHTPLDTTNGSTTVLVYKMGTPIERIIDAVQFPSEPGAQVLRSQSDQKSAAIIRQIRALVGEE